MTTQSAASGSENWETYTDASDEEPDARDAYYAKVRSVKRLSPDNVQADVTKKIKSYGLGIKGAAGLRTVGHDGGAVGVEGSDAGWTDDGSCF